MCYYCYERRAVLRAKAQVLRTGDWTMMIWRMKHYFRYLNIAESLGIIFAMVHPNCLKEDEQFSISDVVEFGLSYASATDYFALSVLLLIDGVQITDSNIRQACGYPIGIVAEKSPMEFRL